MVNRLTSNVTRSPVSRLAAWAIGVFLIVVICAGAANEKGEIDEARKKDLASKQIKAALALIGILVLGLFLVAFVVLAGRHVRRQTQSNLKPSNPYVDGWAKPKIEGVSDEPVPDDDDSE